jgi:hypothetical protein
LYAQAFTILPGETSQSTIDEVSANSLVPSASTLGCSGWFPLPIVLAGNNLIDATIAASIAA